MDITTQNFMVGMLTYISKHYLFSDGCGCDDPNGCVEGCDGTGCGCDDSGGIFECCGCDDSCTYDI